MRSSPAYAVSDLDLPAVTVADWAGGLLALLATAFLAWVCARAGAPGWATTGLALLGCGVVARVAAAWRRARGAPGRSLEVRIDGTFWLRQAGAEPVAVKIGGGTRLLGPSVFLDLRVAGARLPGSLRYWITPLDAPGPVLRQWSVVLPRGGRVACT